MEDFVRKVKKTRLKKKWTQYRLAKESGLSREMIAKLELGRHSPTLETATKICRSLAIEFVINLPQKNKKGVKNGKIHVDTKRSS